MEKELQGREGAVFGIESSLDLYRKLEFEAQRLPPDWHPYDAFNFIVTAWHLFHDWPKSDAAEALSRKKRRRSELPAEMNLVLDVVRDLANGSKHFQLDLGSAKRRRVDAVHSGLIADFYAYLFYEDIPGASVGSNYFSIRVVRNIVMRYFGWVFDDSSSARDFPGDLLETVRYCNIATRPAGQSPALWLQGIEDVRPRDAEDVAKG